jgi:LysM repeat protein
MKRAVFLILAVLLVLTILPLTTTHASPNASGKCTCKAYYKVKKGDYLSLIAAKYGVSTKTLQNCNHIKNRNKIYPGQKLCIPGTAAPKPPVKKQPPTYFPPPAKPGDGPATQCSIKPILGFGNVWYQNKAVRDKLGCPKKIEGKFKAEEQQFHSGYVINNRSKKKIYVFFSATKKWAKHTDKWKKSKDPINNPALKPPVGWYQPEYGIGKIWRNEDNYSQKLGWARYQQRPVTATMQQYENGLMIWTQTGGVFVLYDNDTYQQFK